MSIKVKREHLQKDKYFYTWSRDSGDSPYTGKQDRERVDKNEGYEVIYFIESFMNKHGLKYLDDVHEIENALHDKTLKGIVMRDELIDKIEGMLDY